ncbi:MAG: hypothetical protein JW738_00615 [Actinobacteria bacterium]|nr:hypothetical protein [Actinomycetota bacterium]
MDFSLRQLLLMENAVFLWLTVLPPVSEEVKGELNALLDQLSEVHTTAAVPAR